MDLRAFKEVIEDLVTGYQTGSTYWVTVTNVVTPNKFYVRSTSYDDHLKLMESLIKAEGAITKAKINDIVAYRARRRGGRMKRGQVIGIVITELSITCQLYALDYGYIDKDVELTDIFPCSNEIIEIPPFALQCQLQYCAPVGQSWSEESIEAFKFYLGQEPCKMIVQHNKHNKLIVQLYNSCPDELRTLLVLTNFASLGYEDPFASRIYSKSTGRQNIEQTCKYYFNYKRRPNNKLLRVYMLYFKNFEEFYVAEVEEYYNYKKLCKSLTLLVSKERVVREEELVLDQPVLVEGESKKGCRGIIEDILPDEGASICLVDSGKRIIAKNEDIKIIPSEMLEQPVTAIYCRADIADIEIPISRLKQPGFEFKLIIKVSGCELKIPNIVKIHKQNWPS